MAPQSSAKSVLLLAFVISCFAQISLATSSTEPWIASTELLKQAELRVSWNKKLPIKQNEKLEKLIILDNRLYAITSQNYAISMDRNTGAVVFARSLATAGFPIMGMDIFGDQIISVIDNEIVEINSKLGTVQKAWNVDIAIACPVARNYDNYYVAGSDKRLHILNARNMVQRFTVAAENESMISTVLADDNIVIFGTDQGNVIAINPDQPIKLWEFKSPMAIAGNIIKTGNTLFYACKDLSVYRLDIAGPKQIRLAWKYRTEALPDRQPRVTEMIVYQYAGGRGLSAIDRQTGKGIWSLPYGKDLLAEHGNKAYVLTEKQTLAVMDNALSKRLYWVNLAGVNVHACNTLDSKIYVSDEVGNLACLEPMN